MTIVFEDQHVFRFDVPMNNAFISISLLLFQAGITTCLLFECISATTLPTSAHSFSLLSQCSNPIPLSCVMKICRSPYVAFSKTRTGQTLPVSSMTSQQMPRSSLIFGWRRIEGWLSTNISATIARKMAVSSTSVRAYSGDVNRLNAKLVSRLIDDWRISAVAPPPMQSSAGCHVIGRKSTFSCLAMARKEMKSYWLSYIALFRGVALWEILPDLVAHVKRSALVLLWSAAVSDQSPAVASQALR